MTSEEEPRKEGPWTSNKVGGDAGGYISKPGQPGSKTDHVRSTKRNRFFPII
jgi:hypothetical protein